MTRISSSVYFNHITLLLTLLQGGLSLLLSLNYLFMWLCLQAL